MEIKTDSSYKGTRILFKESAKRKRNLINDLIALAEADGFDEMMIPVIQLTETFASKVGAENQNMMYTFRDRGDRDICLAPEYTAVIQKLASERFKQTKDVKLFYVGECFRGEKPQAGRYRQFTQFGLEILNPSRDYRADLISLAEKMISLVTPDYSVNVEATRGLDYYENGKGFEISCDALGAQKQIYGGGSYAGGIGFAVGVDRMLTIESK